MNYKFLLVSCLLWLCGSQQQTEAQCDRYRAAVFSDVQVDTSIVYNDLNGRLLDVYYPKNDNSSIARPLIVMAHGGSFVGGSKEDADIAAFCTEFAKRGYVAASYNYQLANFALELADSVKMMSYVTRAIQDGKSAVRYFRKSIENGNPYNIDNDLIFVGGNSAGAILSLHVAYMDESDLNGDASAKLDSLVTYWGGLESGANQGYSSAVAGVINLAGGLNGINFLDSGEVPVISCHGDMDGTVPFDCQDVYWGDTGLLGTLDLVDVCGSGPIHERAMTQGVPSWLKVYEGADHVPWSYNETDFFSALDFVTTHLYDDVLPETFLQQYALPAPMLNTDDIVITSNSVTLSWEPVQGVDMYHLYIDNGTEPGQMTMVMGTNYTVDNLLPNQVVMITVTAVNMSLGCESLGSSVAVNTDDAVGVEEAMTLHSSIAPNPVSDGYLYWSLENALAGGESILRITNTLGQVCSAGSSYEPQGTIEVAHLPKGVYCLEIVQNGKAAAKHIFIKN